MDTINSRTAFDATAGKRLADVVKDVAADRKAVAPTDPVNGRVATLGRLLAIRPDVNAPKPRRPEHA